VIRYKYDYAERHHYKQSYEWKYFYSSTFDISDDLIDYLLRHNFIVKKREKPPIPELRKVEHVPKKVKPQKSLEEQIEELKVKIERCNKHIEDFSERIKESKLTGEVERLPNYYAALFSYKDKLKLRQQQLDELTQKLNATSDIHDDNLQ